MTRRCSDGRLRRLVKDALAALEDPAAGFVFDDYDFRYRKGVRRSSRARWAGSSPAASARTSLAREREKVAEVAEVASDSDCRHSRFAGNNRESAAESQERVCDNPPTPSERTGENTLSHR